jgi:hypothetical protein
MRELVAGKQRYGFREVIFKDSYLSGDKSWLRDLMRRYRAEIRAPFKCFCTISGFDEETARLVKWGGCYGIEFGLQTWNETLRRDTLHRRETNEKALQAFDICDRLRLWYDVDHMFNLPGEAEQDHVLGARQYAKLRHLNRIKNHFLVYLPNAAIVAEGRQRGVVPDNVDDLLAEGWEGDFYDQKVGNAEERAVVAAYAALYKVLPVLPRGWLDCLLRDRRVMWLRHVPSVALAAVQGLMALRSGDLRFAEYLRSYPCKVWRAVRAAMAGDAASPRREAAA